MRPRPSPPTVGLTRVIPFDVRRSGSDESPTRHRSRPLGRVDHGERAFGVPSTSSSSSSLPASSAGLTAIAGGAKQRFRVVVRRNPLGRGGVVGQRNLGNNCVADGHFPVQVARLTGIAATAGLVRRDAFTGPTASTG